MHSILFQIGSFTVYTYGVCIALALIAAISMAFFRAEKFGLNSDVMFNAGILGFIFGMVGAKLLYIIVELDTYIENPKLLLNFGSGFVVYGGLVLGIIAFVAYLKIKKQRVVEYADLAIPSVALGQAIGRVGCLMAGCCYGKECSESFFLGIHFPEGAQAPVGVPLYGTQIICIVLNVLLCLFLIWINYREKFAGMALSLYMILYSLGRFFVEFLRGDERGAVGPLSTSQFIAIFTFVLGVALFFIFRWYQARPLKVGGYPEEEEEESEEADEAEESEETEEAEDTEESEENEESADAEDFEESEDVYEEGSEEPEDGSEESLESENEEDAAAEDPEKTEESEEA